MLSLKKHVRSVFCGVAIIVASGKAMACSIAIPYEVFLERGAAQVRFFWLASIILGGLMLGVDVYKRKVSIPLVAAAVLLLGLGWVLYQSPHWGHYLPSCEPILLWPAQLVAAVLMALFVYRAFRVIRPR
jgi:hypothetical protein